VEEVHALAVDLGRELRVLVDPSLDPRQSYPLRQWSASERTYAWETP